MRRRRFLRRMPQDRLVRGGGDAACGGAVRIIACIEDSAVIKKILDHLKERSEPNTLTPWPESRAPPAGEPAVLFH